MIQNRHWVKSTKTKSKFSCFLVVLGGYGQFWFNFGFDSLRCSHWFYVLLTVSIFPRYLALRFNEISCIINYTMKVILNWSVSLQRPYNYFIALFILLEVNCIYSTLSVKPSWYFSSKQIPEICQSRVNIAHPHTPFPACSTVAILGVTHLPVIT